ncbi:MAG TPA: class I SAM-dependent methyltransferase [Acidimicrobiales bacterium]|nr:class I SAM-dependent methyltransferase [Acidimicrobiales bacterium]
MTASPPPWLAHVLACPRCHGELNESDRGWTCATCGEVGRRTLGFPDFLAGEDSLPMAGGDAMDLAADARAGAELAAAASKAGFSELSRRAAAQQAEAAGRSTWSPARQQACDRFHARLGEVNQEAAARGGQALLAKLDAKVEELGWPPLKGSLALEAAGGAGYFLPAFAERFGRVVFVDASLPGLVLAAKLAEDHGLVDVAFVRADVVRLPFAAGAFDFVHENGVIEHVHQPRAMLAEAARVRSDDGYYVCVSPNRFTLAPEPHFGVPLYGAVPGPLRRRIVTTRRGFEDGTGTDLRSLSQLRHDVAEGLPGDQSTVFFLPRRLRFTARQTGVRRLVHRALARPRVGDVVDHALNVTLLPIMPQHVVIARGGGPR